MGGLHLGSVELFDALAPFEYLGIALNAHLGYAQLLATALSGASPIS